MDHSNKKWEPPRATNFDYLKAYVWAMVGNYEPLYKLYMEQEERTKVPGKWRNADSKTVDEVLLRLYNFEKRLLVAALALLYFAFLAFLAVAIVYYRRKAAKEKQSANRNLDDLKVWGIEFGTGRTASFDEFLERHFFSGKVSKMSYYSPPNVLIVTLEGGSQLLVDCRSQVQKNEDEMKSK